MVDAGAWTVFGLLNVILAFLVLSVRPRPVSNVVVSALFLSNGLNALRRDIPWGAWEHWSLGAMLVLDGVSIVVLFVLPFLFPRRLLRPTAERILLIGAALVVVVTGLFYVIDPGLLTGLGRTLLIQTPLFGSAGVGTLILLNSYFAARSPAARSKTKIVLAVYVMKVGTLAASLGFFVSLPNGADLLESTWLFLVQVTVLVALWAVPLSLGLSWFRQTNEGHRARPWSMDLFVLGFLGVGLAFSVFTWDVDLEYLVLRPLLFAYAILAYRMLDVDIFRFRSAVIGAVFLGTLSLYLMLVDVIGDVGVDTSFVIGSSLLLVVGVGGILTWPLLRRMLAPDADETARRDREIYQAALEEAVLQRHHTTTHGDILRSLRGRLGISEREHALMESHVRSTHRKTGPLPVIGTRYLERYRIERELSGGGFGHTFLAHDEQMKRDVVLKVAKAGFAREAKRQLREARVLGTLNHSNILTVHDVEKVGEEIIMVLEYMDGGSLKDRLRAGPLELSETCSIFQCLLAALSTAHRAGILHRDVKPENVLLSGEGTVKLADFGIAKTSERVGTATGFSVDDRNPGTLMHMSPEQVRGDGADARSDLYSAGTVLYEMLTGKPYLDLAGMSDLEARLAVLNNSPPLPIESAPKGLNDLLRSLLMKSPDRRPSDAEAAQRLLARAVGEASALGPLKEPSTHPSLLKNR